MVDACPIDWTLVGNKCYYFSKDEMNFDEAAKTCESLQGKIYTPENEEENKAITDYMNKNLHSGEYYIGINDKDKEGRYVDEIGIQFLQCFFRLKKYHWAAGS